MNEPIRITSCDIKTLKDRLVIVIDFIVSEPPVIHSRESYKHQCHNDCKACKYLHDRNKALDSVLQINKLIGDR